MPSIRAPSEVLSAFSFAVQPDGDKDLQAGTHLRVFSGLGASFPVGPLIVRGLDLQGERRACRLFTQDSKGQPTPSQFGDDGVLEVTLLLSDPPNLMTSSIEIDEGAGTIKAAAMLDQHGRTICVRDQGPFVFSGPLFHKLKVWGAGTLRIIQRMIPLAIVEELQFDRESILATLALPIKGDFPWYLGIQDREAGMLRVERGAPLRMNPMDRPFGNLESVSAGDEIERVIASLRSLHVEGGFDALIERLVSTKKPPPWEQRERMLAIGTTPAGDRPQHVELDRLGTLQLAAADPGVARYLGLADRIDSLPGNRWSTLALFGLFAVSVDEFSQYGLDLSAIRGHTPTSNFVKVYARTLSTATGADYGLAVEKMATRVMGNGLVIAPLMLMIDPVPPWLPPAVPSPQIFQVRWQGLRDTQPSRLYRASFAFEDLPLVSQCALARLEDQQWVSRNDRLDGLTRAAPRLFGKERDASPRINETGGNFSSLEPQALETDHDIDADTNPTAFAVWGSDFFGRFPEKAAFFSTAPPPRVQPPEPVLRFHVERLAGDILPGTSPGVVSVRIAVPARLPEPDGFSPSQMEHAGSATVVPRLDDLPAGAFDIATIQLGIGTLDDPPIDVSIPGTIEHTLPIPPIADGITTFSLLGQYADTQGNKSAVARAAFEVRNFRSPTLLKTGVGLFWSSEPGPAPEVELKLRWNATDGSRYRVYLADQAAMQITEAELGEDPPGATSRGLVAVKGAHLEGVKKRFRLLTDPPVVAQGGGAGLSIHLPRSLETVQFVRVVPLGSDGEEADFGKCGIVAVAVPESRRPAAPRLDADIDQQTGKVSLTVSTDAVDEVILKRDEPGLFHPGQRGTQPPVAFIRRAVAGVPDPIYARQVGIPVAMVRAAATGHYVASFSDDNAGRGLEPYVRYVYWAEWRMPPERRLPAAYDEVASEIVPVAPSGRQDQPRPKSSPSAPRTVMHVPQAAPAAPDVAAMHVARQPGPSPDTLVLQIQVDDPPRAHKLAVGRFRLAAWTKWADGPIEPIRNAGGVVLEGAWPSIEGGSLTTQIPAPGDVAAGLTLMVAFVDPLDRLGGVSSIPVP
ncbi:hypothetical protein [Cupriavidus sp. D384]|uniref:hypothetical protein n=1 Tax=Cupriavidus sp. D384 TaxID=1538095 RepID=UPI000836B1AD|nr:hypothetical protein [Cupriavidus sp. D384]